MTEPMTKEKKVSCYSLRDSDSANPASRKKKDFLCAMKGRHIAKPITFVVVGCEDVPESKQKVWKLS